MPGWRTGLTRSLLGIWWWTAELLRLHLPADVRKAVASPGGSTEAGLEALDREGAREAFAAAVRASLERMRG